MATGKEILTQEFNSIAEDLKKKHIELGMKSSGKWIESLEVQATETKGTVLGQDYTQQLVKGRKPGKFPPIDAIKQWIVDKGIAAKTRGEISISSLAFLIARKIAQDGTRYFQQGGTDLVEAVVTEKRIQQIIDRYGSALTLELVTKIEKEFKQIAV